MAKSSRSKKKRRFNLGVVERAIVSDSESFVVAFQQNLS